MKSFKDFLNEQEGFDQASSSAMPLKTPAKTVVRWKASKPEIINYWKSLRSDTAVIMRPIPYEHKGSTYGEDGVRITGSPQFIASILSRLKEILVYETSRTKLNLVFRQNESKNKLGQVKSGYVFYVSVRERGRKKT